MAAAFSLCANYRKYYYERSIIVKQEPSVN